MLKATAERSPRTWHSALTATARARAARGRSRRIALLAILAGTGLTSTGAQPTNDLDAFETCEAIRAGFRAFRHDAFPEGKWTCEAGVLRSVKGQRVDLITRGEYQDFELELEWKVSFGANSGIMYGVTEAATETYWSGPEMQINDDPHHPDGLQPKTSAGGLYDLIGPSDRGAFKPTGDYNHIRIVSRSGHVEHWLNGIRVVAYEWDSPELRALIQQTKFAQAPLFMKQRRGHIALQSEGDEVWFRHIRIRRLSPDASDKRTSAADAGPAAK
ncbi:3-keto-disaccharide hydrolase [Opitutus terrae]|uniref:3-keto-alpha-glucoside-1,2-lyase/3-keto-2-hydroxy-glucal hydratase domain-containing protein n=1 Tax=Opitutus terrae (strain DSM 11246 / JCM 15787 / PB90-1) TaxID=452637 RepID=B1ZU69_OPITP|nr:DUF1080 domain-containing protein [Opitutus terrae]ACB76635.1 protein of unknown function DUF1080 [Opitutus terrae PB90-1]